MWRKRGLDELRPLLWRLEPLYMGACSTHCANQHFHPLFSLDFLNDSSWWKNNFSFTENSTRSSIKTHQSYSHVLFLLKGEQTLSFEFVVQCSEALWVCVMYCRWNLWKIKPFRYWITEATLNYNNSLNLSIIEILINYKDFFFLQSTVSL